MIWHIYLSRNEEKMHGPKKMFDSQPSRVYYDIHFQLESS